MNNLRVYCTVFLYFVKVTFEYADVAVAFRSAIAVGVKSVCAVRPRTVLARTVAVAVMVLVARVVPAVVVTVVLRRGPKTWFGVTLEPATVGKMDDIFVITGMLLTAEGNIFVPTIVRNVVGLHISGFEGPRMASSRYATRDPAVSPILYDRVIMFPGIKAQHFG